LSKQTIDLKLYFSQNSYLVIFPNPGVKKTGKFPFFWLNGHLVFVKQILAILIDLKFVATKAVVAVECRQIIFVYFLFSKVAKILTRWGQRLIVLDHL